MTIESTPVTGARPGRRASGPDGGPGPRRAARPSWRWPGRCSPSTATAARRCARSPSPPGWTPRSCTTSSRPGRAVHRLDPGRGGPELMLAPVLGGDVEGLGERVTRAFLSLWEAESTQDKLLSILRSAVSHPASAEIVRGFVTREVLRRVAERPGRQSAGARRAGRLAAGRGRHVPVRGEDGADGLAGDRGGGGGGGAQHPALPDRSAAPALAH
ncbi:hypothetical protein NKH77_31320 [Streptomyces sp. M19]